MPDKLSKSEQSKVNGSKSKGPKTAKGKAKSSQNGIKHGFCAVHNLVLSIEDEPAFHRHLAGFRSSFKPRDYVEQSFVDQLAAIQWRQSRLVAVETCLIDAQIALQDDSVWEQNPENGDDDYLHLTKVWQALAQQPLRPKPDDEPRDPTVAPEAADITSLELCRKYQVSLDRQFRNTLANLRNYRKEFATTEPVEYKPEPEPEPEVDEEAAESPGTNEPEIDEPEPDPFANLDPPLTAEELKSPFIEMLRRRRQLQ